MPADLRKFQVKIKQKNYSYEWVHFCYIPFKVSLRFDKYVNNRGWLNNRWVSRWGADDFGLTKIDTTEELAELKRRIREQYKERYPEIYMESDNDNQGWLRVWVVQHMKRELEEVGKPCK